MHNLQGAFSESIAIYLEALKRCLDLGKPPHILSLGLGLGYNEIISIAYTHQQQVSGLKIVSYEKDENLVSALWQWCQSPEGECSSPWGEAYQNILERSAKQFNLGPSKLKQRIQNAISSRRWIFPGPLGPNTIFSKKFYCIFYDAFSEKTDPQLWTEEFLENFLQHACQEDCVFSTYAAKGALNRALQKKGFTLLEREGFAGKKQSTLALLSQASLSG